MRRLEVQFLTFAWLYASRSLWRHRQRTSLIIATVALSVTVSIVGTRYSKAVLKIWEDGTINHGTGQAQMHAVGYFEHPDLIKERYSFTSEHAVERLIREDSQIAVVSRRLLFEGVISSGGKSIYFLGRGVEAEAELQVSPDIFHPGVDAGSFVQVGESSGIVIGRGLAHSLSLKVGDEATIMTQTLAGGVNGIDVTIVGIVDPPMPSLSKRLLYMSLESAQKALQIPGRYTEVAIRLHDGRQLHSWWQATLPKAQALAIDLRTWWQIEPLIKSAERLWDSILGTICFLLFVSAGISVLNIVYMLITERTVEIGTLMAIGARSTDIRALVTLEASLIGLFGGMLGAGVGNAALLLMDFIGVPFDSPFGSGQVIVHPQTNLMVTLLVTAAGVALCYLSALAPARQAARVEPVIAFRGQLL